MKKIVFLFLNLYIVLISAQNTEWIINSTNIDFKIKNAGFIVDGTFSGFVGKVLFDESKNTGNSIEGFIDSKTINTTNKSRDSHLKKAEYFDVEKYPKIILKSTLIKKEKDGSFTGYFNLTLKDKTQIVIIPFTYSEKNNTSLFKGTFKVNRIEYGVGESSMILSEIASLTIKLNATKK